MQSKNKKFLLFILQWGLTLIVAGIILIPLYWIFISSITPANELFKSPIDYIPAHPTIENYITLFAKLGIVKKAFNTLIISFCAIALSIITCFMASYAFSRYKSKGLAIAYGAILFSALIPGIVTARPLYDFFKTLQLVDTFPGLILLYTTMLIPFTMLILRNFLSDIPISLEEAAEIDGANFVQKMLYVILPLMRPAIATISIINFILCLNDLFIPLFFSRKIEVLSVGITTIPRENSFTMPWDLISTMGWIILLPIIIFVLFFEKHIMEGIMAGGVKE